MTVDTKHAKGRRSIRYETLDDLLEDAERLAGLDVEMVGNWSLGQVFNHLSATMEASLDGFPFRAPWAMRLMSRYLMKKRFLTRPIPAGFGIPKQAAGFDPPHASAEEGLARFRAVIDRLKEEPQRVPHPFMGQLTHDEWTQFHLRHAELHMSFAVPNPA